MNAKDPAVQLRIRTALQTLERIPVGLPADALVRLEAILASGKTQKKEAATAESTFFGLEEDMNALAEALVKERKTAKNTFAKEYEEDTE